MEVKVNERIFQSSLCFGEESLWRRGFKIEVSRKN